MQFPPHTQIGSKRDSITKSSSNAPSSRECAFRGIEVCDRELVACLEYTSTQQAKWSYSPRLSPVRSQKIEDEISCDDYMTVILTNDVSDLRANTDAWKHVKPGCASNERFCRIREADRSSGNFHNGRGLLRPQHGQPCRKEHPHKQRVQ